jgi:hypothetical protein
MPARWGSYLVKDDTTDVILKPLIRGPTPERKQRSPIRQTIIVFGSVPRKRTQALLLAEPQPPLSTIPAAAAFSFLKDTRGDLNWTARDLAKTLKLSAADAKRVVEMLQLQGYIKPSGRAWVTTPAGETVSGSKLPRYSRETVERALRELKLRINEANRDKRGSYKITDAVAFGDFLGDRPQVQAADVGISFVPRTPDEDGLKSAHEHASELSFLRQLKARSPMLNVRPYEEWMNARLHRKLL